jgi:ABC-type glutathione transport system ATPase component
MEPILSESRVIDTAEAIEPVPWVVPDFAASGCLTILAGTAGIGKTTLALQLAAEVGTRQSPSLYLDVENGPAQLRRFVQSMDLEPDSVNLWDMQGVALNDRATVEQLQEELLGRGIVRNPSARCARLVTPVRPRSLGEQLRRYGSIHRSAQHPRSPLANRGRGHSSFLEQGRRSDHARLIGH